MFHDKEKTIRRWSFLYGGERDLNFYPAYTICENRQKIEDLKNDPKFIRKYLPFLNYPGYMYPEH
jgi:hypothetical protein